MGLAQQKKKPRYLLGGFIWQCLFAGLLAYWFSGWPDHLPEPGYAVTILGVAAAIMAVRADDFTRTEKIVWIGLAVLLCIIEIQAIRHDRDVAAHAQAVADRAEREAFDKVRRQITGGDSYIAISPNTALSVQGPNTFTLTAYLGKNGDRYGVFDANVLMTTEPIRGSREELQKVLSGTFEPTVFSGSLYPGWSRILQTRITPSKEHETTYYINTYARNGATLEVLRIRFNQGTGQWEHAYVITRDKETLEHTEPEWRTQVALTAPPVKRP